MTLALLKDTDKKLYKAGIKNPRRDSEILLSSVLKCDRIDLYLNKSPLNKKDRKRFSALVNARLKRKPIQYITKETEFMGLKLLMRPGVFIPRPETELLAEEVLRIASAIPGTARILDIGTGSGNIAIALTKNIRNCKITGLDISSRALALAERNAELNGVGGRIEFIQSDIFAALEGSRRLFDIIVSNPPYVVTGYVDSARDELTYEPRLALDGGKDGLYYYQALVGSAGKYLKKGGHLLLEIGANQSDLIQRLISLRRELCVKNVIKDYHRYDRVIIAQKK